MTRHVHVCLSVTTSWNCNLWASNWPEFSFLVFVKCGTFHWREMVKVFLFMLNWKANFRPIASPNIAISVCYDRQTNMGMFRHNQSKDMKDEQQSGKIYWFLNHISHTWWQWVWQQKQCLIKKGHFLVSTIRWTVTLVSKCDVAIVRAVWALIIIWMHIKHTWIFDFKRKSHTSTRSLQWTFPHIEKLKS